MWGVGCYTQRESVERAYKCVWAASQCTGAKREVHAQRASLYMHALFKAYLAAYGRRSDSR